jgi:hypothetical protein
MGFPTSFASIPIHKTTNSRSVSPEYRGAAKYHSISQMLEYVNQHNVWKCGLTDLFEWIFERKNVLCEPTAGTS